MASASGHVHLVGSLGLPDAETAFRAVAEHLGARAKRYPDGEPGDRSYWIRWQNETFARHPDFELREARSIEGYKDDKTRPLYVLREGADTDGLTIDRLGYADAALSSWSIFTRLQEDGVIPDGVRFLVCFPSTGALITSFIDPGAAPVVEPAVEAAMQREVEEIARTVPAENLAIQFDVAYELIAHDGGQPPVFYDDVLEGSTDRLARHIDWVPEGVEAGIHLCYGDPGHKHVIEPKDLRTSVAFANGIAAKVNRKLDWIHLPVPRDRDDDAYAAPLADLKLGPETELYVGCIHHTDGVDGSRRRMATAAKYTSGFGIATECGFGRRDPETLPDLFRIHAEATDQPAGA